MQVYSKKIYTIEEIEEKLRPVFDSNGVTKAILFGSYAKGEQTEDSDIDLVVATEDYVRGFAFCEIASDVIDCLDKDVDLICMKSVIPNGRAYIEIKETGRVIYEKEGYRAFGESDPLL